MSDVFASLWRTGSTFSGCLDCEWDPGDVTDETAAGRRHITRNPTHVVAMRREQVRTIRAAPVADERKDRGL